MIYKNIHISILIIPVRVNLISNTNIYFNNNNISLLTLQTGSSVWGACVGCTCGVRVWGACVRCMCGMRVRGACVGCMCGMRVLSACVGCVCVVRVCGECVW